MNESHQAMAPSPIVNAKRHLELVKFTVSNMVRSLVVLHQHCVAALEESVYIRLFCYGRVGAAAKNVWNNIKLQDLMRSLSVEDV